MEEGFWWGTGGGCKKSSVGDTPSFGRHSHEAMPDEIFVHVKQPIRRIISMLTDKVWPNMQRDPLV